jgi:hypothetical protein
LVLPNSVRDAADAMLSENAISSKGPNDVAALIKKRGA